MTAWTSPDGYVVSTDPDRLDVPRIHRFLRDSYWSPGIPLEVVARGIENSLPFGLYAPNGEQVGFARMVTDRATFAYLADVYVEEQHRGRGLGVFLVGSLLEHPDLQATRRMMLATADAHELYRRFGFDAPARPERLMSRDRDPAQLWPDPA